LPDPVGAVTKQSAFWITESASSWKGSGVKGVLSGVPMDVKILLSFESAPGVRLAKCDGFLK
jgi:hypothetical protein